MGEVTSHNGNSKSKNLTQLPTEVQPPLGYFDPLGLSKDGDFTEQKTRFRLQSFARAGVLGWAWGFGCRISGSGSRNVMIQDSEFNV